MFIPYDTRIWEVFNDKEESLGAFLYGDMVIQFNNSITCIQGAYNWLKHINYSYKEIGNIYPLSDISNNDLVEEIKIKFRKKEAKKLLKERKKRGYKLSSIIKFGKHSGKTIKQIIEKEKSYWQWLVKNDVLLLHPELNEFI